jgi:hypothetical protein
MQQMLRRPALFRPVTRVPVIIAASLLAGSVSASAQAALKTKESIYTRHNYARCPSRGAEGGTDRRACLGVGSIEVFWTADRGSAAIWFGPSPIRESIDLGPTYRPAEAIEWRLDPSSGRPKAAIVLYRAGGQSPVVVYRLEPGGASCIMAVLRGKNADARARTAAADESAGFRCGRSKRREE